MPLTREPKYKDIHTDEVDQKGGYVAKVRDKEARAAAKEAAETAKADLDAYKETNDAAVADLDDRLDQAELDIDAAEDAIDELEDALDVLILVQDTQPTSPDNKIWIKETATPVEIPEMSDLIRPNLLDNWYFVGGGSQLGYGVFPINQRGQTSYVGSVDAIDRWYGYQAAVTINVIDSGLSIHRSTGDYYSLVQKVSSVKSLRGKQVTATLLATGYNRIRLLADGVIIGDSDRTSSANPINSVTATIPNDAEELLFSLYTASTVDTLATAAKLELGSTQTLAHQESGVWVLNELPKYRLEVGGQWVKVWENASPNSAFASQTVAVDLSPYTWAKIEFLRDKGTAPDLPLIFCIMEVEIDPKETTTRHVASGQANTSANDTFGRRIFTVRPTGVFFDVATWYNTYNSGGAQNTNVVIPYRIYAR